jgi:hypothetical protein
MYLLLFSLVIFLLFNYLCCISFLIKKLIMQNMSASKGTRWQLEEIEHGWFFSPQQLDEFFSRFGGRLRNWNHALNVSPNLFIFSSFVFGFFFLKIDCTISNFHLSSNFLFIINNLTQLFIHPSIHHVTLILFIFI